MITLAQSNNYFASIITKLSRYLFFIFSYFFANDVINMLIFRFLVACYILNCATTEFTIPENFSLSSFKNRLNRIGIKVYLDSSKCAYDIKKIYFGIKNKQIWALKFLDATSKIQPGLLDGNFYGLGSFEECLGIDNKNNNVVGKYCLGSTPVPLYMAEKHSIDTELLKKVQARWGVCVPNSCGAKDVRNYIGMLTSDLNVSIQFSDDYCYDKYGLPYSNLDIAALLIFSIILALVFASSAYDLIIKQYGLKTKHEILIAFSVQTNLEKLFEVKSLSHNRNIISSLVGMRLLSMYWVILAHTGYILLITPLINPSRVVEIPRSVLGQLYVGGTLAVDTFLVMSGVLVSYVILNYKPIKCTNIPILYLHRYFRLTPALAAMMLFQMSVAKHIFQGPVWNDVWKTWAYRCDQYWWTTLLYIQNYINPHEVCLGHSWYLSVDMQLFMVAPFLIILFHKCRKLTYPVLALLTFSSMIIIFLTSFLKEIPAGETSSKFLERELIYVATHTRAGPWLLGMALGYYLHNNKGRIIILPKFMVIAGWIMCFIALVGCTFGQYFFIQPEHVFDPKLDPVFLSCNRIIWALVIVWIIIACENGYGGFIHTLLSWKYFLPWSRLTYSQYLVHSPYQRLTRGATYTPVHGSNFVVFTNYASDLVMTTLCAIVLYLTFEAPLLTVEKMIFQKKRPKPREMDTPKEISCKNV